MKICIAGKNQIAVNAINYLLDELKFDNNSIYVCPNKTDNGIDTWQPSLKLSAVTKGIKIVSLKDIYNIENLIFISLEYDKLIKTDKFKTTKLFNIHFSLLPQYKGMYTSIFPILHGKNVTGVTLHEIDNGIDTGRIIAQKCFEIKLQDTARDLYFNYLSYGFDLFKEEFENILYNKYFVNPQSNIDSSYYSKDEIDFQNLHVNFNNTSFQIHNQIRAFIFEEYQLPKVGGKKIKKCKLTNEKIKIKSYDEINNKIVLSGIDGYKIILETL